MQSPEGLNLMFSSDDNSFFQMLSRSAWGIDVVAASATDILMEKVIRSGPYF
ncbi:hypothetical protein TWF225_006637 [Orbilia oligospora]|uniref:Uncharacterized protein n=1 Tax=Orbilia oligospora TaxID=2813651 RepID=A0A7C8PHA9_ORBOL|nr:hypothetical protein TWF751_007947 [Orbilia oligospora]KAF3181596.1 hypothetical protein TWF225_006637 [Orbilia oligospora]KAF3253302.1 hypothetical protein TWF217_007558 [Orbilia oligospora]KAF3255119.1 hypothetical protein TWF128_005927 [Orbilia oligospora]KAF3298290.1 hypothetical protein TWF132_000119 [Orbilia oligospora]